MNKEQIAETKHEVINSAYCQIFGDLLYNSIWNTLRLAHKQVKLMRDILQKKYHR